MYQCVLAGLLFSSTVYIEFLYDITSKHVSSIAFVCTNEIRILHITLYWWYLHRGNMFEMGIINNKAYGNVYKWVIGITLEI